MIRGSLGYPGSLQPARFDLPAALADDTVPRISVSEEFEELASGYELVTGYLMAPNSMQLGIVIEALLSLQPDPVHASLQPEIQDFQSYEPIVTRQSLAA
jgi:hypothetical protein